MYVFFMIDAFLRDADGALSALAKNTLNRFRLLVELEKVSESDLR